MIGIDYSFSEPNFKDVKAKGYSFALSYFSRDQSKDWGKDELNRALDAGLSVGAVYELGGKTPLGGYNTGVDHANDAIKQAKEIGYTGVLYFAVDFRPSGGELIKIQDYFRGVNSILGKNAGVYGSYEVLDAVKGYVSYGWQVSTWGPKGQIHPLAAIVQDANASKYDYPKLNGVDYNYSTKDNMGLMGQKGSNMNLTWENIQRLHRTYYGIDAGENLKKYVGQPLDALLDELDKDASSYPAIGGQLKTAMNR